jgi:sarcosine oxidase subunit beta
MLLESIEVFHDFDQRIGGKCGFIQTGWIGVTGEKHENRIRKVSSLENELGVQSSLISPSAVEQLEPGIFADDLTGAVYEPRSGYADPVDTTISFGINAERLGARILTGVNVTQIITDGSRVSGIKTENGTVNAKKVVVAANVWSPKLFHGLGLTLPISPTRKQVCIFKPTGSTGNPRVVTDDFVNDLYMKPEGEGILVGEIETPGSPVDPENFAETIDYDTIPKLANKLLHRFPAMSTSVSRGGYAGPYDVSPDGHPILDEIPGYDGLYCAVGFSGHGFRFSPVTGRLMAEFIMDGKTKGVDIGEFRLSRFSEGKPIVPLA